MYPYIKSKWFIKSAFLTLCLTLSSCTTLSNPSSKSSNNAQKVDFLILTTSSINPDIINRASPVRLDIFQLKTKDDFIYSSYADLISGDKDPNSGDSVSTQHILKPDSIHAIPLELEQDVDYIGITIGYREIEEATWKIVLQKQPNKWGDTYNYLYLKVAEDGISQLSKSQMKAELSDYAKRHPDDERVTKNGNYKKPKYDYSKGIFNKE